jgi:hypothetical protein
MNLIITPSVNPNIVLTTVSTNSALCSGNSATITASGANNYTWQPSNTTGSVLVVTPPSTSFYTLVGSTGSGCTNSIAVIQTVNPTPSVTVVSSGSICSGTNATLTATGASTYTWLPGNLSGSVVIVSPSATTVYTITGALNNCTATRTLVQIVNPTPTVSVLPSTSTVCPNVTFTLTASGANNYTWQPGNVFSSSMITSLAASTVYTVTGASADGC